MKILTFIYHFFFVICVAMLASCSDQTEISSDVTNRDAVKLSLIQSLDSINESLAPSSNIRKGSQNTTLSTKDKISIALADARGAYKGGKKGVKLGGIIGTYFGNPTAGSIAGGIAGAVIVGGLKSYIKYKTIEAQHSNYENKQGVVFSSMYSKATGAYSALMYDSIDSNLTFVEPDVHSAVIVDDSVVNSSHLTNDESKIGLTHNLMVAYLDGKIALDTNATSLNTQNQYVETMFESDDFVNSCMKIASDDQSTEETDLPTEVMNRFSNLYERYVNNCNDVALIIRKYIEVIDNSPELSQEDKENLKYGFATALYSTNYWGNELKQNDINK